MYLGTENISSEMPLTMFDEMLSYPKLFKFYLLFVIYLFITLFNVGTLN